MAQTYLCYVHKRGSVTPDLRVVACPSLTDLPDAIAAEMENWGQFEVIDVYDERDHRLFSFTQSPRLMN